EAVKKALRHEQDLAQAARARSTGQPALEQLAEELVAVQEAVFTATAERKRLEGENAGRAGEQERSRTELADMHRALTREEELLGVVRAEHRALGEQAAKRAQRHARLADELAALREAKKTEDARLAAARSAPIDTDELARGEREKQALQEGIAR